jgi:hypothetical protein
MTRLVYKKLKWKNRKPFRHQLPNTGEQLLKLLVETTPRAFMRDEFKENLIRSKENPKPVKLVFIGDSSKLTFQTTKVCLDNGIQLINEDKTKSIDLKDYKEIEILVR